ncbi:hypothetical protein ACMGOC_003328 [Citrobacter freundii]
MKKAALGGLFCFLLLFVLTASLMGFLEPLQASLTLILWQREEQHFDTPYDPATALTCNAICPILNLCRVIRLFVTRHRLTLCRYPLMREKCFGGVVAGVEPASIGALPIGLRAPCGFHREFLPQAYSLARR